MATTAIDGKLSPRPPPARARDVQDAARAPRSIWQARQQVKKSRAGLLTSRAVSKLIPFPSQRQALVDVHASRCKNHMRRRATTYGSYFCLLACLLGDEARSLASELLHAHRPVPSYPARARVAYARHETCMPFWNRDDDDVRTTPFNFRLSLSCRPFPFPIQVIVLNLIRPCARQIDVVGGEFFPASFVRTPTTTHA